MATNAMLVKYKDSDKQLKEEDAKNIESYIIPEKILIFIHEEKLTKNIGILEEDTNDEIEIMILGVESLEKILIKIKKIVKDKSHTLCSDDTSDKEDDIIFNDIKQLLDLRGLCLEKTERYSDKNYILVQVG